MSTNINGTTGVDKIVDGTVTQVDLDTVVAFLGTKSGDGYQKLANGLIIQWGSNQLSTSAANTVAAAAGAFPVPFPTALLQLFSTAKMPTLTNQILSVVPAVPDAANWSVRGISSGSAITINFSWLAVGY